MAAVIQFEGEAGSNAVREAIAGGEPVALRTFTPSQAVFAKSAGMFHFTPEGRRLYDYSSGVLVANLGHNPRRWMQRWGNYMGWDATTFKAEAASNGTESDANQYISAVTMTAYNAITELEAQAVERLRANLRSTPLGSRMEQVLWSASGSEAVQKALWAALHFDTSKDIIVATRYGFHGKKGLANAVTGHEQSPDRDPRVQFISFPREECDDLSKKDAHFDPAPYREELDQLKSKHGNRISCLITEPYLGGGGSYHPPAEYLQMLVEWCRENSVLFILDEVQSNFGRTGKMYAFEKYGIEPDIVCLGKGLGNGVPVSAAVGRADVLASLKYGEGSDTWSANPLACAAVLATLDEFESTNVMQRTAVLSETFTKGLMQLKETGVIAKVRGEGMVFGIECAELDGRDSAQVATDVVRACYVGKEQNGERVGIHLLGPLAGNVIRISPPMTITDQQAEESLALLTELVASVR